MLLANSENLTPQLLTKAPASLAGKGEPDSPPLRGEGLGEGSDPSSIRQRYLGNRGYKNVREAFPKGRPPTRTQFSLRGALRAAQAR
jgi:hypothetical protein